MPGLGDPTGTRLVPMTKALRDDLDAFWRHNTGIPGAGAVVDAYDAAPADTAREIERAILGTFPDLVGVRISLSMDHSERAATACARRILAALGCVVERPANTGDHHA